MSAPQGSFGCRITVSPSDADVLRVEAKKVLMFNHEDFEDFLDHVPVKQLELADIYRDATAVIDALGWDPDICIPFKDVEVPLTQAHVEQLHKRRTDLLDTNLDLLNDMNDNRLPHAVVDAELHDNRHAVDALNRIFTTYTTTINHLAHRTPIQGLPPQQECISRRTSVAGPDPTTDPCRLRVGGLRRSSQQEFVHLLSWGLPVRVFGGGGR